MGDVVVPIKLGMVNAYLLRAREGFVLVDTGLFTGWEKLESALKAAGCLPDGLNLVVITHGDFDHTGGCAQLQQRYGAKIAMHEADVRQVETGVSLEREIGFPLFKVIMFLRKVKRRGHTPEFQTFEPDLELTDGQSLEEYGVDAKILHLPGHTPGSIVVLLANGDVIAGDTVSNMVKPGRSPFIWDRAQLRENIGKLKRMDLGTIYPGHGRPFTAAELRKIEV